MPHIDLSVRRATAADLQLICDLAQELNFLHHQAWPDLFAPCASPSIDAQHWSASIAANGRAAFVAERAGSAVGFITASVADETHSLHQPIRSARVNSVCVVPSARGQGTGTALMAAAERWASGEGAVDIQLVVWAFNERAVCLYKELGYAIRSHTMGKSLPSDDGR